MALDELLPVLQDQAAAAEKADRPHILGLAATCGWQAEALQYVRADVSGHSYSHRLLLPCLIDLREGQLVYNHLDQRILPFVSLFSFTLEGEEIQRVIAHIHDYLLTHEGLPIHEIAEAVGVTDDVVEKTVARLQEAGSHKIERIRGLGPVIVRRTD
jgi:hypothetical protein